MPENQKAILITGAGGSVGSTVAELMLKVGHNVGLCYRSTRHEKRLKSLHGFDPKRALLLQAELNNPKEIRQAVAQMQEQFGTIDMLFNAIGGWLGGKKLHEHSLEELQQMLIMDLIPTFNAMHAVLPVMEEQQSGCIVNFISMTIFGNEQQNSVYAASKSAVKALTDAAVQEYHDANIQLFAIAPATIDSESNRQAMPDADYSKWVSRDAIAELAFHLLENSRYLSGTIFRMSG